jgi:type II restriction enzyme
VRATASYLVKEIERLDFHMILHYPNPGTSTTLRILGIQGLEGPIEIERIIPGRSSPVRESISSEMLWRYASSLVEERPVNVDRVFGGSYNTRSALETVLAHTGPFYLCYPGRIIARSSTSIRIVQGHKHLLWLPRSPHEYGKIVKKEVTAAIAESHLSQPMHEIPRIPDGSEDPDALRRHLQIQSLLVDIGCRLGMRTWVAANDRGAEIGKRGPLGQLPGVLADLDADESLLRGRFDAISAARLVDCIWMREGRYMPAVIEVEHSTGVTSGLTRMNKLRETVPSFATRYTIAAPDEARDEVVRKAADPQFCDLHPYYLPYSAIEELFDLSNRRVLPTGPCGDKLIEAFIEELAQPVSSL